MRLALFGVASVLTLAAACPALAADGDAAIATVDPVSARGCVQPHR
jgi:hypothetical protein